MVTESFDIGFAVIVSNSRVSSRENAVTRQVADLQLFILYN